MDAFRPRVSAKELFGISRLAAAIVLCSVAAVAAYAYEEAPVFVSISTPSDSLRVGKRTEVVYEITYPDTLSFLPPPGFREEGTRLISFRWKERELEGEREAVGTLRFMAVSLDSVLLPGLDLIFLTPTGDTLLSETEEISLPVKLVTTEGSAPRPLKGQWVPPAGVPPWAIAVAVLIALAAGFLAWRKFRAKEGPVAEERPALPPDVVALRELAEIERSGLLDQGKFKEYYSRVIDTMRRYIEERFGVEAMERTTDELLLSLGERGIRIEGLEEALREADLVKFAKFVPGIVPGKRLMEECRRMIGQTAPRHEEQTSAGVVAGAGGE